MDESTLAGRVERYLGSDIATFVHLTSRGWSHDAELRSELRRTSLRLAAAFARADVDLNPDHQLDALDETSGLADELEALVVVAMRVGVADAPQVEELTRRLGHLRQLVQRRLSRNLAEMPDLDDET
ncbi:MAG: hypothetical protein HPKKFMNG_02765 [Planctomycetes bacterium]|nr:hypothetical protein [Planctomycetota bacterium]HRJ77219.1 hypothetical protein [Planctomycetota bacterium]